MKKTLKKVGLHKPESERTKVQKILRDVACFSVVIVAAVLGYFLGKAELDLTDAEYNTAEISIEHAVAATSNCDSEVAVEAID